MKSFMSKDGANKAPLDATGKRVFTTRRDQTTRTPTIDREARLYRKGRARGPSYTS